MLNICLRGRPTTGAPPFLCSKHGQQRVGAQQVMEGLEKPPRTEGRTWLEADRATCIKLNTQTIQSSDHKQQEPPAEQTALVKPSFQRLQLTC